MVIDVGRCVVVRRGAEWCAVWVLRVMRVTQLIEDAGWYGAVWRCTGWTSGRPAARSGSVCIERVNYKHLAV